MMWARAVLCRESEEGVARSGYTLSPPQFFPGRTMHTIFVLQTNVRVALSSFETNLQDITFCGIHHACTVIKETCIRMLVLSRRAPGCGHSIRLEGIGIYY